MSKLRIEYDGGPAYMTRIYVDDQLQTDLTRIRFRFEADINKGLPEIVATRIQTVEAGDNTLAVMDSDGNVMEETVEWNGEGFVRPLP